MGMTDRQFDVFLKNTLRTLERIRKEIQESGNSVSETLETYIKDIEEQLNRP